MPYPFGEWLAALDRPLPEAESVRLYLELRAPRRPVQPGLWNSAPPHAGVMTGGQPEAPGLAACAIGASRSGDA